SQATLRSVEECRSTSQQSPIGPSTGVRAV
ncbi:hypothetical protein A2U01_0073864, partial [Trifolium medium]|nr:hypothetical protein [Trifolium medium]